MSDEERDGQEEPQQEVTLDQREAFRQMYARLYGIMRAVGNMERRLKGMSLVNPTPSAFVDLVFRFNAEVDVYYREAPRMFAVDMEMVRRLGAVGPDLGEKKEPEVIDAGDQ